jgi:hypothetical protein
MSRPVLTVGEWTLLPGVRILGGSVVIIGLTHAFFRFLRWAVEFSCGRIDMRSNRVERRERELEERVNVELSQMRAELGLYREATMVLVEALSKKDPTNPALTQIAKLLRSAIPIAPHNPSFDDLLRDIK